MIQIARFSVEAVLPLIGTGKPRIRLEGHSVKASSTRLECFRRNQSCVRCKRKGTLFILEQHGQSPPRGVNCFIDDCQLCNYLSVERKNLRLTSPHLNLYHVNRKGGLVLMTQDHIVPRSRGGPDRIHNLQTMCRECNSWKGNRLVRSFEPIG